ncbi:efflux RND transporter periplasmic adaptor subunit [Corallococcus sp. AS-1-12]|uniref:efflux RND transporter periplasmic adaptor subunit n=1 Tax=Corallococcus sp. AS-1-12 TaxID=2874598 RepID=UPI001CC162CF|nr:efflux RND transporter periplasmic adaptor subunit [Corallococcus sp. AS-1-12]MBZ4336027.1 efflux RND transporter periplasmic adaptor subunit [Corallococcus sp. AS-1-12]
MMRHVLLHTLLLLGAVPGCASPKEEPPATARPEAPRPSSASAWVQPRPARGVPLTEAPARVLPSPEGAAVVGVPLRASVSRVAVRPGQQVKKGHVLMEVRMPEAVQAAGRHQAATLRREAYARRREQLLALQAQGMARLTELAEAETQLAEAQAEAQAALALLAVAGLNAADAAAVARGGPVPLRSPVDGVVTEVSGVLGETREGGGEPLVRIMGAGEALLEARFARPLPAEARFELVLPGEPPLPLKEVGRAPAMDPRDGTTAAWFIPETPRALPSGLTGRVRVRADSLPGVSVVPARALLLESGQAEVLVRTADGFRRQPVEVVATSGAEALVRGAGAADVVAEDAEALLLAEGTR